MCKSRQPDSCLAAGKTHYLLRSAGTPCLHRPAQSSPSSSASCCELGLCLSKWGSVSDREEVDQDGEKVPFPPAILGECISQLKGKR